MEDEKKRVIADGIIKDLSERGLTCKESIEVIQIVDGKIRKSRAILFRNVEKASLEEIMREARC